MRSEEEFSLLAAGRPLLASLDDAALNAEAAPALLDGELTPAERFFVRNNGRLPEPLVHSENWVLRIDGAVERPQAFTLAALKARFPTVSVTAVLECAGNGRAFFHPPTEGIPWHRGAVGCAVWQGIRLADLLAFIGLRPEAIYTAHHSPDRNLAGTAPAISRGLPIAKALAPETLLAFGMNGAPLPHLNGGPLRIVAPGFPGSAWQKWLNRLELRDREHDGAKMGGLDYRLPRRPVSPGEHYDPAEFEVITDMPVKSMITAPADGFVARIGEPLLITGKAWSGHVPLDGVDLLISPDAQWIATELAPATDRFAWRSFRAIFRPEKLGALRLGAVAMDAEGHVQPLGLPAWNPRGYCNNGTHFIDGWVQAA